MSTRYPAERAVLVIRPGSRRKSRQPRRRIEPELSTCACSPVWPPVSPFNRGETSDKESGAQASVYNALIISISLQSPLGNCLLQLEREPF